jgi:hypothetical protein
MPWIVHEPGQCIFARQPDVLTGASPSFLYVTGLGAPHDGDSTIDIGLRPSLTGH